MNDKVLITSLESEQAVIGGLLLDNTAWGKMGELTDKAFYFMPNRLIYRAILNLLNANKPADLVTVQDVLEQHGKLEEAGGVAYLIEVYQNTPSAANIAKYAQTVRERHALRVMRDSAQEVMKLAMEQDGLSLGEKQEMAMKLMTNALSAGAKRGNAISSCAGLAEMVKQIDINGMRKKGELLGLPTGLRQLDLATQGLQRGWLSVVAGRPSMGKSVLAENIARTCAKAGYRVLMQSYEMADVEMRMRGTAAEGGIDFGELQSGKMSQESWDKVNHAVMALADVVLNIDCTGLTVDELAAECRLMKQQQGLDLLVIDHLHIMPRPYKTNETLELGEITGKLKRLAMELDIHVLLVAQLSRGAENRTDKRPTMADLRGSGSIEQDANLIIFPYRAAYYDKTLNPTEAELIIAKNRNGKQGTINCGWFGQYQRFENACDPFAKAEVVIQQEDEEWVS